MPFLALHTLLWLLVPGMVVPPSPDSQDEPESSVSIGVGILAVSAVVLLVVGWIFLKWLSARGRKRAESNLTNVSR